MSRVTVMIGAMKQMTAGHYRLITEAVADSQCPEGVVVTMLCDRGERYL